MKRTKQKVSLSRKRPLEKKARTRAPSRAKSQALLLAELLARISASFIDKPAEEMDEGLCSALREIGEFAGLERGYVVSFEDGKATWRKTHEWCAEGADPRPNAYRKFSEENCPWLMRALLAQEPVWIRRVSELPREASRERSEFEAQGVRSALLIPMFREGFLHGFVGFDSVGKLTSWRGESSGAFKILGRVFVNAQKRIEEKHRSEKLIADQQAKISTATKLSALGEMAAGIAHEINNPLSIIHGKAGQLKDLLEMFGKGAADTSGSLISEMDAIASKIEQTSLRISRIVKGLRSFARDGESDPVKPVSIRGLVGETLELCREKFKNHGIEVRVPEIPGTWLLECREVEISQVLLNLLSNAHDAVEKKAGAWVELSVEDLGGAFEFSVSDNGGGVPDSVREKLFQPFFTTKGIGKGTGLGLSISKGIIEGHQGMLRLDTQSPQTCFLVTIPKEQTLSDQLKNEVSILVVDDVRSIQAQIGDLLKRFGFKNVTTVSNGQEACLMLGRAKFHLVLSDWRMSPLDGLEFLKQVRSNPNTKALPFVMVTANDKRESVVSAIHAGVDEYLLKPLTLGQVQNKLYRLLLTKRVLI